MVTFLLSALVSRQHSCYGILTLVFLIPSLFIYDPFISALRLWSSGKDVRIFLRKNYSSIVVMPLLILIWFISGIFFEKFPSLPLLIFLSIAALYFLSFYIGERRFFSMILSVSAITSLLLLIVSAFDLDLSTLEMRLFLAFSASEILIAAGPHEIIQSRIQKYDYVQGYLFRIVPVYLAAVIILIFVLAVSTIFISVLFMIILTSILLSYLLIKDLQIKKIGIIAAVYSLIILMSFTFFLFASV
ncbi:MAG: hypothetical protein ACP5NK_00265 [Thermoplasmata archaeon]